MKKIIFVLALLASVCCYASMPVKYLTVTECPQPGQTPEQFMQVLNGGLAQMIDLEVTDPVIDFIYYYNTGHRGCIVITGWYHNKDIRDKK